MNIVGKLVILRAIEKEDLEFLREMMNDPEVEYQVVGWSYPISKYKQEKWFENVMHQDSDKRFIIETKDKIHIGLIVVRQLDWKNRTASIGIKIAKEENRKKGFGSDAIMAVMRFAFDELCLNRLEASRLEYNFGSARLFHKCGWTDEGIKRESIYKGGKFHDQILMRILSTEYRKYVNESQYWS